MGISKWIGGTLGFAVGGPLGALLGFLVGSLIDKPAETDTGSGGYEGQRNSFLLSLLALAAYIIRADKRIYKSEKLHVQNFLLQNFGRPAATQGMDILEELLHKEMDINPVGRQIAQNMEYSQRLQLFLFLIDIAKSDGNVSKEEIAALKHVAIILELSVQDVESMLNIGGSSVESAYKVLEITPESTDDEIRKAYKKMVLKYHPDRVATLGADIQRAAEENLKKINAAYETIRKARGIN